MEPLRFEGGLDHVTIAVRDLEAAAKVFENLGFVLKKGRLHDNSIQNYHAKFKDGTELELITASRPDDPVAAGYVQFLSKREGAAFLCLYEPRETPEEVKPNFIFWGRRNFLASDSESLYAHANGAVRLTDVWLFGRGDAFSAFFTNLGYSTGHSESIWGKTTDYWRGNSTVRHLDTDFPMSIRGVTVQVKNVDSTKELLTKAGVDWRYDEGVLFAEYAVGDMFLEFRE